jgi:hypothetical protein
MRLHGLLDALPLGALFVATLVVALLSFEGGFWVGRRSSPLPEQQQEKVVSRLVGGILGLLAFMVAFTFGPALVSGGRRKRKYIKLGFYRKFNPITE